MAYYGPPWRVWHVSPFYNRLVASPGEYLTDIDMISIDTTARSPPDADYIVNERVRPN